MSKHIITIPIDSSVVIRGTTTRIVISTLSTGIPGKSAYEIAVANGFVGTEVEWLLSLKGDPGTSGGGTYTEIIQTITSDGINTLSLINALPGLQVFINGLAQTDYSYTSALLTLPASLNLLIDDVVKITYFRG